MSNLTSTGVSCRLERMVHPELDGVTLGAKVILPDDRIFFLDRPTDVSNEAVEAFLSRMLLAQLVAVNDHGHLVIDGAVHTQLVIEETRETVGRSTVVEVDSPLSVGLDTEVIKDEGSSEKTAWRWQLGSFASNAFGAEIPTHAKVVLLPGASSAESDLWQGLGFGLDKQIMVEGKTEKCAALKEKFSTGEAVPQFVEAFLGEPKDCFPAALKAAVQDTETAVLSFDTEVHLKPQLYDDVLAVLEDLTIGQDLVLILNVTAKRGRGITQTLENFYQTKTGQPYTGRTHPRAAILEQMPQFLLADLERSDLRLEASHLMAYTGFGAARMECLFAHFKRS